MKYSFSLVVRFVLFTLLFFVLSRANINGVIFPFAFAMFFALAWANQKVWLLSPAYVLGYIATFTTFEGIINATVTVSMLVIPYYIHYAIKKPMKKYELFVYALFSQFSVLLLALKSDPRAESEANENAIVLDDEEIIRSINATKSFKNENSCMSQEASPFAIERIITPAQTSSNDVNLQVKPRIIIGSNIEIKAKSKTRPTVIEIKT